MSAHPRSVNRFRNETRRMAPIGNHRNCSIYKQFKNQQGGRLLNGLYSRVKRWACRDCAA